MVVASVSRADRRGRVADEFGIHMGIQNAGSNMAGSSSSSADPIREVRRLLIVLDDWFVGIRDDLAPLAQSLADGFVAVDATGRVQEGREYLEILERRKTQRSPTGLTISDPEHRRAIYGTHLITFHMRIAGSDTTEVLTYSIWLRETDQSPTGLHLLSLQETPVLPPEEGEE